MFPVSWIIQARLADVATIVDENINGVRVVKSFAAEQQQLRSLAKAADRLQWGYVKDADLRARFTPLVQNLPQVGLALVLLFGGYMVIHGSTCSVGAIVAFNAYLLMLQAPFMMLGMIIMMGQRAAASAERIYEILDEQPTVVDAPDAVDLVDCQGDVRFGHVDFAYDGDAEPLVLADFDLHLAPGETVALVGPHRRRQVDRRPPAHPLLRREPGSVEIDGHDVRDLTLASLRANVGIVLDEPFLFSVSIRDNIAYGKPVGRPATRSRPQPRPPAPTSSSATWPTATTRWWASAATRCRAASASASPSPGPCWSTRRSWCSTTPPAPSTSRSSRRSMPACGCQMEGRTTLIIAHRLSTIRLADRVVLLDQHKVVADGTHAELLATTPLYAEVLAQAGEFEAEADDRPEDDGGQASGRRPAARSHARCGARRRSVMTWAGVRRRRRTRRRARCRRAVGRGRPALRRHPVRAAGRGRPAAGLEPEHAEPDHRVQPERLARPSCKRLTLWRLLTKYPGMLVLAGLLVVVIARGLPGRAQAHRDRHQRRHASRAHLDFAVVVAMAVAYLVSIVITAVAQRSRSR